MSGEGTLFGPKWPRKSLFERMSEAQRLPPERFSLSTCDPRFNPAEPLTVNGYGFAPTDRFAGSGKVIEDEDMGGALGD